MSADYGNSNELFVELIRQISNINTAIRECANTGLAARNSSFLYGYQYFKGVDSDEYRIYVKTVQVISDQLEEYGININSRGYVYISDAAIFIIDQKNYGIVLNKDVYPYIAEKHKLDSASKVEHDIRNAINSSYTRCYNGRMNGMIEFHSKPSNKTFLLRFTQEVIRKVAGE